MDTARKFNETETAVTGNQTANLKRAVAGGSKSVAPAKNKASKTKQMVYMDDLDAAVLDGDARAMRVALKRSLGVVTKTGKKNGKRKRSKLASYYAMSPAAYITLLYQQCGKFNALRRACATFTQVTQPPNLTGYCYLVGVRPMLRPLLQSLFGSYPPSTAFNHPLITALAARRMLTTFTMGYVSEGVIHLEAAKPGLTLDYLPYIGNVHVGGLSKPTQIPYSQSVVSGKTRGLLELHRDLFTHARNCGGTCNSVNCGLMKEQIAHANKCRIASCKKRAALVKLQRLSDAQFLSIIATKFPTSPMSLTLHTVEFRGSYQPYVPGYCYLYAVTKNPYQGVIRAWLACYLKENPSVLDFDDDVIRYLESKRYLTSVAVHATRKSGQFHCTPDLNGPTLMLLSQLPCLEDGRVGAEPEEEDYGPARHVIDTLRRENIILKTRHGQAFEGLCEVSCALFFFAGFCSLSKVAAWIMDEPPSFGSIILFSYILVCKAFSVASNNHPDYVDKYCPGYCYQAAWTGDIGADPDAKTLAEVVCASPDLCRPGNFVFEYGTTQLHLVEHTSGVAAAVLFRKLRNNVVVTRHGETAVRKRMTVGRQQPLPGFMLTLFLVAVLTAELSKPVQKLEDLVVESRRRWHMFRFGGFMRHTRQLQDKAQVAMGGIRAFYQRIRATTDPDVIQIAAVKKRLREVYHEDFGNCSAICWKKPLPIECDPILSGKEMAYLIDRYGHHAKDYIRVTIFPTEHGMVVHCTERLGGNLMTMREFRNLCQGMPNIMVAGVPIKRQQPYRQTKGFVPKSLRLHLWTCIPFIALYNYLFALLLSVLLAASKLHIVEIELTAKTVRTCIRQAWKASSLILYLTANHFAPGLIYAGLALIVFKIIQSILGPWTYTIHFMPIGSRGDVVTVSALYNWLHKRGYRTQLTVFNMDKGNRMLAHVENNQFYKGTPAYCEYGESVAEAVLVKGTVVCAAHGGAGAIGNVVTYSNSPDPMDIESFKLLRGTTRLARIVNGLARYMFVFENPDFRIGITHGCVPRSADGENFLSLQKNCGKGSLVAMGSSNYPEPEVEGLVCSTRPRSNYPFEDDTQHTRVFTQYEHVYCHGGAGTVQTALMSGCVVHSKGGILDRDVKETVEISQHVSFLWLLHSLSEKMTLWQCCLMIKDGGFASYVISTRLLLLWVWDFVTSTFNVHLFMLRSVAPWLRTIGRSRSVAQACWRFLTPSFMGDSVIMLGIVAACVVYHVTINPVLVMGGSAAGLGFVLAAIGEYAQKPLLPHNPLGPVYESALRKIVHELMIMGQPKLLLVAQWFTQWLDPDVYLSDENLHLEMVKITEGWLKWLPFYHWRLADPLTRESICISVTEEGIVKTQNELEDNAEASFKFDSYIPKDRLAIISGLLEQQVGTKYGPFNNCQTNIVKVLWKVVDWRFRCLGVFALLGLICLATSLTFLTLCITIVPPVAVWCYFTRGEFMPDDFSKILTSAGSTTLLTPLGYYNYIRSLIDLSDETVPTKEFSLLINGQYLEFAEPEVLEGEISPPVAGPETNGEVFLMGSRDLVQSTVFWEQSGYKVVPCEAWTITKETSAVLVDVDRYDLQEQAILRAFMQSRPEQSVSISYDCIGLETGCCRLIPGATLSSMWLVSRNLFRTRLDDVQTDVYLGLLTDKGLKLLGGSSCRTSDIAAVYKAVTNLSPCDTLDVTSFDGDNIQINRRVVSVLSLSDLMYQRDEVASEAVLTLLANVEAFKKRMVSLRDQCASRAFDNVFSSSALKALLFCEDILNAFSGCRGRSKNVHAPALNPIRVTKIVENDIQLHPEPEFQMCNYETLLSYMYNTLNNAKRGVDRSGEYADLRTDVEFVRDVNRNPYIDTWLQKQVTGTTGISIQGIDGQVFACRPVMIASLARYIDTSGSRKLYATAEAMIDDDIGEAARLIAARNPELYLNATPAEAKKIFNWQLKASKKNFSPGLPFIGQKGFKKRKDILHKGFQHAVIKAAIAPLETGLWMPALAHSFPKSQVVKGSKLSKSLANLRTVTATSLINNLQQLILNFDVNNRHAPYTSPAKPGLILNGSGLSVVFENARKFKYNHSLDMTKFDSTIPRSVLQGIWELRSLGYKDHPAYETIRKHLWCQMLQGENAYIVNLVDTSPDELLERLNPETRAIFDEIAGDQIASLAEEVQDMYKTHGSAPGGVVTKGKGGLTGDANTTFNNTTGTQIVIIIAVSKITGKPVHEFYEHNDIANTGDDNIFSTNLDIDLDEVIQYVRDRFGIEMRCESSGSDILEQTFLGKKPHRGDEYKADFELINMPVPEIAVLHDVESLVMRYCNYKCEAHRKMKTRWSSLTYRIEKCNGYLNLCAHQKELYDLIRKNVDGYREELNRIAQKDRRFSKLLCDFNKRSRTPSYKKVLQDWYKPIDPQVLAHAQVLKMDLGFEAHCTKALNGFLTSLVSLNEHFRPHLFDCKGESVYVRDNNDGLGLFEAHIYYAFYRTHGRYPSETEFISACERSPFNAMCRPRTWFTLTSKFLPKNEKIAQIHANLSTWNVVLYSVIYAYTPDVIEVIERVPFGNLATILFNFVVFKAKAIFSTFGYAYYLGYGDVSEVISTVVPKDSMRYHKRLALWIFKLVPTVYALGVLPADPLVYLADVLEQFSRLFTVNVVASDMPAQIESRPDDSQWGLAVAKSLTLVETHQTPLITSPTGTGKTKYVPSLLLGRSINGKPIQAVLVVMPRRILCQEYAQVARASWIRKGQMEPHSLMTCTYGFLAVLLATGKQPSWLQDTFVVYDEAHENSVEWEYLQANHVEAQKCLLLSATPEAMTRHYIHVPSGVPPLFHGAQYKRFGETMSELFQECAASYKRILVIHPSLRECEALQRKLSQAGYKVMVLSSKNRRIPPEGFHVIATAIADAGLTIPGCDCVIDSGLRVVNDRGLVRHSVPIDNATSIQRRGRTCRTNAGDYYLLNPVVNKVYTPSPDPASIILESPIALASGVAFSLQRNHVNHLYGNNFALTKVQPPSRLNKGVSFLHILKLAGVRDEEEIYTNAARGDPDEQADFILAQMNIRTFELESYDLVSRQLDKCCIYYLDEEGSTLLDPVVRDNKLVDGRVS